MAPAVDIVEKDNAYGISAGLPGMDEKDIEVKLVGDVLTIKENGRRRRRRSVRTTTFVNAAQVYSSAVSVRQRASTAIGSPQRSRKVC